MFNKIQSVSKILSVFTKTVDKLRAVEQAQNQRVDAIQVQILDLDAQAVAAGEERDRAKEAADKISALFG